MTFFNAVFLYNFFGEYCLRLVFENLVLGALSLLQAGEGVLGEGLEVSLGPC